MAGCGLGNRLACEAGFDPVYGARPLKRAIQDYLENPLSKEILSGNFIEGDVIKVDIEDEQLIFDKKQQPQAA